MKVCFPPSADRGMDSEVYGHVASAPLFIVVDTAAGTAGAIIKNNQHHTHGMCNPIPALDNQPVDAIVVDGADVLNKLNASGIRVFQAKGLPEYTLQQCCGGNGPGSGCAH
ncbi:MAG: NifB/NifX family molybdenum-iron cluster-binding protein [Syntrophaceae bacterium]